MPVYTLAEIRAALDRESHLLRLAGSKPRKVVLAHGCFDVCSISHVRHLEAARQMGDILIVTVSQDQHVCKGPNRPVFSEQDRAEMVAALKCVDYAAINEWPTAVETIKLLRPSIYVKGNEYRDKPTLALTAELDAIREVGGMLRFTNGPEQHTSEILKRMGAGS